MHFSPRTTRTPPCKGLMPEHSQIQPSNNALLTLWHLIEVFAPPVGAGFVPDSIPRRASWWSPRRCPNACEFDSRLGLLGGRLLSRKDVPGSEYANLGTVSSSFGANTIPNIEYILREETASVGSTEGPRQGSYRGGRPRKSNRPRHALAGFREPARCPLYSRMNASCLTPGGTGNACRTEPAGST